MKKDITNALNSLRERLNESINAIENKMLEKAEYIENFNEDIM